jgi:type IV secretory pathway VirB2 component (pilin)
MGNRVDSRYVRLAAVVLGVVLANAFVSQVASAQDLQPVNDIAEFIRGFMTGRLATSLAVIAVAVVGYLFWAGQIAAQAALAVVAGIALVFGSAQIVAILEAVAR